jgi:hypothetical protein
MPRALAPEPTGFGDPEMVTSWATWLYDGMGTRLPKKKHIKRKREVFLAGILILPSRSMNWFGCFTSTRKFSLK